jgi:polar amino acid transport system substrate-binding protein
MSRPVDADVRARLAPTGVLRVALNHANFLLVTRPAPDAVGVAPDLGRELARRIDAGVVFVGYENAGLAADAAPTGAWDVAFIGADPARADEVTFSPPYAGIEATYLVPAGSAIRSVEEVDAPGVRIAVAARSAYDLFLERTIRQARLVRADGITGSCELFVREGLEALAGLRPRQLQDAAAIPGARVLDGGFMTVQQAIGTPRGRGAAAEWVAAFVRDVVSTGLVADLIARHEVRGLTVMNPPGS